MVGGPGKKVEVAVKPLREKGSHVELVAPQPLLMATLSLAFSRAHFSQILVSLVYTLFYRVNMCPIVGVRKSEYCITELILLSDVLEKKQQKNVLLEVVLEKLCHVSPTL